MSRARAARHEMTPSEARLAVEIDGQMLSRDDVADKDAIRTRWLESQGIGVLRIAAEDVRVSLDGVLGWIRLNAERRVRG